MTNREQTGGPAFPRTGYYPDDTNDRMEPDERRGLMTEPERGMTLRDYFAAKAMQGELASQNAETGTWTNDEKLAAAAYSIADAMIAARDK